MKQAVALTAVIVLGVLALSASAAGPASTVRVSVSSAGVQGDRDSYAAGIGANGRFVLFNSRARNLVAGDTNDRNDVFLADPDHRRRPARERPERRRPGQGRLGPVRRLLRRRHELERTLRGLPLRLAQPRPARHEPGERRFRLRPHP